MYRSPFEYYRKDNFYDLKLADYAGISGKLQGLRYL